MTQDEALTQIIDSTWTPEEQRHLSALARHGACKVMLGQAFHQSPEEYEYAVAFASIWSANQPIDYIGELAYDSMFTARDKR